MSADQLRRAAEDADSRGWSEDHAVAAVLRTVADYQREGSEYDLIALLAAVDKVAAAYLGEEPQP